MYRWCGVPEEEVRSKRENGREWRRKAGGTGLAPRIAGGAPLRSVRLSLVLYPEGTVLPRSVSRKRPVKKLVFQTDSTVKSLKRISERAAGVRETDAVRQALVFVCLSARASGGSLPVSYDEMVPRRAYPG